MSEQQPTTMFQAEVLESELKIRSASPREIRLRAQMLKEEIGLLFAFGDSAAGVYLALTVSLGIGSRRGSIWREQGQNGASSLEGELYLGPEDLSGLWDALSSGATSSVTVGLSSDKLEVAPGGYEWDSDAVRELPISRAVFAFRRRFKP